MQISYTNDVQKIILPFLTYWFEFLKFIFCKLFLMCAWVNERHALSCSNWKALYECSPFTILTTLRHAFYWLFHTTTQDVERSSAHVAMPQPQVETFIIASWNHKYVITLGGDKYLCCGFDASQLLVARLQLSGWNITFGHSIPPTMMEWLYSHSQSLQHRSCWENSVTTRSI